MIWWAGYFFLTLILAVIIFAMLELLRGVVGLAKTRLAHHQALRQHRLEWKAAHPYDDATYK